MVQHILQTLTVFFTLVRNLPTQKVQQIELSKMIHTYQTKQDDDYNWNDTPMAAQQPNSSSPTHHLAKVPSFGVK